MIVIRALFTDNNKYKLIKLCVCIYIYRYNIIYETLNIFYALKKYSLTFNIFARIQAIKMQTNNNKD